MKIESAAWSRHPGYEDLEMLADGLGGYATEKLDEHLEMGGELIDPEFELQHPDIFDYTTVLTRTLGYEMSREACEAAYKAAHYAYLISEQFVDDPVIATKGYFGPEETNEQMRVRIHSDTQAYLQHRPALDALIGRYMPEIDSSLRHATLAETVATLVFIQIEIGEKRKFITSETEKLENNLAEWDGNLNVLAHGISE